MKNFTKKILPQIVFKVSVINLAFSLLAMSGMVSGYLVAAVAGFISITAFLDMIVFENHEMKLTAILQLAVSAMWIVLA